MVVIQRCANLIRVAQCLMSNSEVQGSIPLENLLSSLQMTLQRAIIDDALSFQYDTIYVIRFHS